MNPSQKSNLFLSQKAIWAIFLGILAIWSYFSFNNWIGISEFWPISLSGDWENWKSQPALTYKILFHLSMAWVYLIDLTSVEHIKIVKLLYTFFGALSVLFFFLILRKHILYQKAFIVTLIFLLSNLGFSQIGLIRSDFLSFFVTLLFFYSAQNLNSKNWLRLSLLSFFFSCLVFSITPKSIYFVGIIFVFTLFQLEKKFWFVLFFGWSSIISYFLLDKVLMGGAITRALFEALNFYAVSYQAQSILPFLNENITLYLLNDAHLWGLILLGILVQLIFCLFRFKTIRFSSWAAISLLTATIIISHKPALPFFVGSYWGFLFLGLIPLLKLVDLKYLIGTSILTLGIFAFRWSHYYYYPNAIQYEAIESIESFVKTIPDGKSFDGIGTLPRSQQALFYLGPDDENSNRQVLKLVTQAPPELIIYSARLRLIEPEIGEFLNNQYNSVGMGYWLRKDLKSEKSLRHLKLSFFIFGYYPVPSALGN